MIIYIVRNVLNGKVYIGQTRQSLSARRRAHLFEARNGSRSYFHAALRAHGTEAFVFEEIVHCFTGRQEDLNNLEKLLIADYAATSAAHGYNLTTGGDAFEATPQLKQYLREKRKNFRPSEAHKRNIGLAGLGRKATSETLERMRINHAGGLKKGSVLSVLHRQQIRAGVTAWWAARRAA